jgi:hypothetical protein
LRIEVMLFVFIDELHAVNMLLAFLLSIWVAGGKSILTYMAVLGNNLQTNNCAPTDTE